MSIYVNTVGIKTIKVCPPQNHFVMYCHYLNETLEGLRRNLCIRRGRR